MRYQENGDLKAPSRRQHGDLSTIAIAQVLAIRTTGKNSEGGRSKIDRKGTYSYSRKKSLKFEIQKWNVQV